MMGISVKTLQRRTALWNVSTFSVISDSDLVGIVRDILNQFPTIGETMLIGHLKARGIYIQRFKVRNSIYRIRGRRQINPPISRRICSVPGPNFLWHADGKHKLIRYMLMIHGAIDGFYG